MPEKSGEEMMTSKRKPGNAKGKIRFTIRTPCDGIDRIEILGNEVQKVENISELFGKEVDIRIIPKRGIIESILKMEPECLNEVGELSLVGYSGAVPLLQIGSYKRVYVDRIEKIEDWAGFNYPLPEKAPT